MAIMDGNRWNPELVLVWLLAVLITRVTIIGYLSVTEILKGLIFTAIM
jgi:hypothetical protein